MNADISRQASNQGRAQPAAGFKDQVTDALDRGRSGIAELADTASDNLSRDVAKLREDLAQMQKTVSKFASDAGGEAYKAVQDVGSAVASQVGDAASTAKEQIKTVASEIETMTRRNPLGAIGATLLVGVIIGMMSRGRS